MTELTKLIKMGSVLCNSDNKKPLYAKMRQFTQSTGQTLPKGETELLRTTIFVEYVKVNHSIQLKHTDDGKAAVESFLLMQKIPGAFTWFTETCHAIASSQQACCLSHHAFSQILKSLSTQHTSRSLSPNRLDSFLFETFVDSLLTVFISLHPNSEVPRPSKKKANKW
jgi:hypothetical protein